MRRLILGATPFALVLGTFGACSQEVAQVGMALRAPQGVLDTATALELRVATNGNCDPETGGVSDESTGDELQSFEMTRDCASGAAWCADITLERDDKERIFHVLATGSQNTILAEGCTIAAVDQDPLVVNVTIKKYTPPACCNDGIIQPGEQCDSGIVGQTDCSGQQQLDPLKDVCGGINQDDVCSCDCVAREILLSIDDPNTIAIDNAPGSKSQLALAFAGSAGNELSNGLRAVYTDSNGNAGTSDINARFLKSDLFNVSDPPTLAKQLRLPIRCSSTQSTSGIPRQQKNPAIDRVAGDTTAIVYASDEATATRFDIWLNAQGPLGCTDVAALQLNANVNASAEHPDVAGGPDGVALVVWNQAGELRGRIWTAASAALLPASEDLTLASGMTLGSRPRVAGNKDGWVVTYAGAGNGDGDGIFTRSVALDGSLGDEVLVNSITNGLQEQPDIAMADAGNYVVVWLSGGAVFFQGFDEAGNPRSSDQDSALSQESPPAQGPVVAAGAGRFVVAWPAGADPNNNAVWARFVNGDGTFGFNSINGQNTDFRASHPAIESARTGVATSIGGASFVAIGWQDLSDTTPGVFVRRFPLPE